MKRGWEARPLAARRVSAHPSLVEAASVWTMALPVGPAPGAGPQGPSPLVSVSLLLPPPALPARTRLASQLFTRRVLAAGIESGDGIHPTGWSFWVLGSCSLSGHWRWLGHTAFPQAGSGEEPGLGDNLISRNHGLSATARSRPALPSAERRPLRSIGYEAHPLGGAREWTVRPGPSPRTETPNRHSHFRAGGASPWS